MTRVPDGWSYTPTRAAHTCHACGHRTACQPGWVVCPNGRRWPLISDTPGGDPQIINAIVAAHQLCGPTCGVRPDIATLTGHVQNMMARDRATTTNDGRTK